MDKECEEKEKPDQDPYNIGCLVIAIAIAVLVYTCHHL